MIRKRRHTLKYTEGVQVDGYRDGNGDWVPGTTTETEKELICRVDVNSGGKTIKNNDGQDYVYQFSIFLNRIPESLKRSVNVRLYKDDKEIGSGVVIMPFEFQARQHNRIFI